MDASDEFGRRVADAAPPEGFVLLRLPEQGYMGVNGPLWGRREGAKLLLGLRVEHRHCNPAAICHGGMVMTFADMQLALGSNFERDLKRFLPTVHLSCDYLAAASQGAWLWGRTEVLRQTKSLLFAQCLLYADETLAARVSGIMKPAAEPDPRLDLSRLFD